MGSTGRCCIRKSQVSSLGRFDTALRIVLVGEDYVGVLDSDGGTDDDLALDMDKLLDKVKFTPWK